LFHSLAFAVVFTSKSCKPRRSRDNVGA